MIERLISKIWLFFKKLYIVPFVPIFFEFSGKLIIKIVAKVKKMELHPNGSWGTELRFLLGWVEPESVAMCKKILRPGMNVLDLGADIGYYSRLFSKIVGPQGRVYAFEPYPETYSSLLKNINFPKYKNIIPIQKAVSDKAGKVDFFEMKGPCKHSFYDVSKSLNKQDPKAYILKRKLAVEAVCLDEFLDLLGNPEIHFIKMDIEGAEPKALQGLRKTILMSKNLVMLVEFFAGTLLAGGVEPGVFLEQLKKMGFKIQALLDPEGEIKSISQLKDMKPEDGYINLLCFK